MHETQSSITVWIVDTVVLRLHILSVSFCCDLHFVGVCELYAFCAVGIFEYVQVYVCGFDFQDLSIGSVGGKR